jgi:hypothetical protein
MNFPQAGQGEICLTSYSSGTNSGSGFLVPSFSYSHFPSALNEIIYHYMSHETMLEDTLYD